MELCSNKHEEVCYEGRICPVCDMREELEGAIKDLEQQIIDLERETE